MAVPSRQIGWSTESNLLWQICNQIDRMTGVIGSTLSTFVPQSRTLTINGVTYDLSADRSWTVAAGISGSGATGQVAYWNGTSSQTGSNNLFWDAANSRLGIGTNTPSQKLHVVGSAYATSHLRFDEQLRDNRDNGIIQQSLSSVVTNRILTIGNGTYLNINFPNGNILLGTTIDAGQRLQVIGDTFLKGSGNTGATTALSIQNSDGTALFQVTNGQIVLFNTARTLSGAMLLQSSGGGNTTALTLGLLNPFTATSGDTYLITNASAFQPTSGTGTYAFLSARPTINQTGGANGITRGVYVQPTLTAAADWRSIEWSNNTGWGLYGAGTAPNYLGGDLTVSGVFRETVTTNRQTASYTLALADNGKLVEMNVATANNLTIPLNSSIAFPIGTKIDLAQYGAGQTTVVATGGVTVRSAGGALKLALQYSGATLVKIATDEWYLFGDITT